MNLTDHFLIALPDRQDERFKQAVILVCDHNEQGALGVPLGRIGTPEDIGAAVVFMASPAAAWITGQCLYVDGGC